VGEKRLITSAKIVQSILSIGRFDATIFGTLAVTGKAHRALAAVTGQSVLLVLAKFNLLGGGEQLDQMNFPNISQFVRGLYKMVTGIQVAVMF
jgi:hypothetical protein